MLIAGRTALLRIVLVAVAVVLATSLRPPEPAFAVDHIAEIHEVMVGFDGDPEVQYVEVNMRAFGQNATTGVKLSAFDASGTFIDADPITIGNQPLLTVSGIVPNSGAGVRWLMGTTAFEAASGIQVDFEYPPMPVLPAGAGMVCLFENLRDFTNPTQSIDCVAYGGAAFTGSNPNSSPSEAATSGPGDGQRSLTRTVPSTFNLFGPPWALSDDANHFALAPPSPENNAGAVGSLPPKLPFKGDTDGDGCPDAQENLPKAQADQGGGRDWQDPWDYYDVSAPKDGVIDLLNDILGVIQHYQPLPGGAPPYDIVFDRGPQAGPNPWNMTAPDGVIDLLNDILGVIRQHAHNC